MNRFNLLGIALIVLATAGGCPGDGSELMEDMMSGPECGDGILDTGEECDDGNNIGGDDCSADCSDETATLAYIQANIFSPTCTPGCHVVGGIAPMSLASEALSFQNLVNVPSEQTALFRVAPGDPDSSYVIVKLENRPGIVNQPMPLGGPPLEQDQIDSIINWIANGANP